MIRLTLYVVQTPEDAVTAAHSEIYDFVVNGTECEACGIAVGPYHEVFFPCVVVVDLEGGDDDAWPVCLDCAAPLIDPHEWVMNLDL